VNRRNTKKPPCASSLRMVIESLESRAMLAGVGPESWSEAGLAPAPLGTGALLASGVLLTCSSPTLGSSGTSSPPAPTSGSGGTTSGGDLWDSFSVKPGAGGSTSGSTGGLSTNGPALSSQYNGGSSAGGQGNGTVGPLTNDELWRLYWSVAGAGSSSGPANGSRANDPTLSAKYTGGSGGGMVFFVTGATGADAASSGSQQVSTGSTTLTLADGQSPVMTTPLVYQSGSDDGPGIVTAVWTGGEGGWQVIQMSDGENSYDDGAPNGEPQGDPWPLRLPGITGFSQFTSMGEPGWGDDVPVFRPGDVEAARGLTGLAKMVHDHGLPVARRAADSNGRVVVYTFTDGTTYMEPVEPPSEQYINSAAVMVPGGIALSRGKGLAGAARAIAAEAIDDAATSRASQAANAATGGYLKWIPAPIASILFGGKPKPRVTGTADEAADAAGRRATSPSEAVPNSASKSSDSPSTATSDPLSDGVSSSRGVKILPQDVSKALTEIDQGLPRSNVRNPKSFANDGRGGTPQLPTMNASGKPLDYIEHTVNPRPSGGALDGKRLVIGSDGSVWYTDDHFGTWTRVK